MNGKINFKKYISLGNVIVVKCKSDLVFATTRSDSLKSGTWNLGRILFESFVITCEMLFVGFCILLRVYPLMLFLKTIVRNNVFCARFYCALLTTYTVVTLVYFMYILPEDGHRSGPKHVVSSAQ
jgi:hypothetical protein